MNIMLQFANGDKINNATFVDGELIKGTKYTTTEEYDGAFNNLKYHGQGKLTLKNGNVYEGEFREGKKHGVF